MKRRKLTIDQPPRRTKRRKGKPCKGNGRVSQLGRPRKLSDSLIEEATKLVLEGLPIELVCDYLSITPSCYYGWKEKGDRYLSQLFESRGPEYPEDEDCAVFVQAFTKAKAEWAHNLQIRSFGEKFAATWVRDMTQLERRYRHHWGRNETFTSATVAPLPDDSYL